MLKRCAIKTVEPYTPIQYVMGTAEFCGLAFRVDGRVLIPRPETELLVESAGRLASIGRARAHRLNILDLCTGSGNIAISLAHQLEMLTAQTHPSIDSNAAPGETGSSTMPAIDHGLCRRGEGHPPLTKGISNCKIIASDISADALEVAAGNAMHNGVYDSIEFVKSDLFSDIKGQFDIIVSNPPYIAENEFLTLQEEVLREPKIALYGGVDGLDFYRRIVDALPDHLKRGGYVVMEIGYLQRDAVADIIARSGAFKVSETVRDHNGIDRVIIAKWIN